MSSVEFGRKAAMRGSASLLVLAAFAAAVPALAQAESGSMETIVVTGVRASLENAIQIKRNADTVVDSISSKDIGVFPDKSISDALQRVPGITVNRLQSNDDSTHPSGEPTNILLRGLTQVMTEFNGRDSFSADGHRGLNFNDISPEMLTGVDSYKNQTADMIEGGIAGTVNLRTRLPFDADDHVLSLSGKANYNTRSDDVTWDYSGMGGKNFDTPYGRIGLLVGYANSHVITQTNSVIELRDGTFCSTGFSDSNGKAIVGSDGSIPCTASPYGTKGWAYLPSEVNYSKVNYDRRREGKSAALQYANNSNTFRAYFQYNDSSYRNAWLERSSNVSLFSNMWGASGFFPQKDTQVISAFGTSPLTFNADGTLHSGTLASPIGSSYGHWTSYAAAVAGGSAANDANGNPLPYVNYCGAGYTCTNTVSQGLTLENQSRVFDHAEGTHDYSTNVQWDVTPDLHLTADGQYISAKTSNTDILVADNALVNAQYNFDGNGSGPPSIKLLPGDNINYAPGFLSNPHNYFMNFIQDHAEKNNAQEIALRGDAEYDMHNPYIAYIKAGVRYANRKQVVRYSSYNWQPVSPIYDCDGPGFNIDNTSPAPYPAACASARTPDTMMFRGYGANIWETTNLGSGFYGSNVFDSGDTVFLKNSVLKDPNAVAVALSGKSTNEPAGWNPVCTRANVIDGCYTTPEILDVSEKTTAGYLMVGFGGDDLRIFNGITVAGNAGARYVKTELTSTGGISYPTQDWYTALAGGNPCNTPVSGNIATNMTCWLNGDLKNFSNGGNGTSSYTKTSYMMLPSFNVKFGLTDTQIVRFAVSEALSRPDFGYLRNYVAISSPPIDTTTGSQYVVFNGTHDAAHVTGYNFLFRADAGNAALKPMTAWQYDATYEWYFSNSGAITIGAFLKELNNSIAYGSVIRQFTNNGATENVLIRGPVNSPNGGELWGTEFAYQQFFDFLPDPFDGLGAQVNYTHTHQSGIHNANLAVQAGYTAGSTVAFGYGNTVDNAVIDSHRLAGISDDSYNIVALYEKGPIAMRVAYNWRSSFLTDNLDCCNGVPTYQKSVGFIDAHIGYTLDEHIELSLDGSNLLDTPVKFQEQLFGDTSLTPNAKPVKMDSGWSKSGRLLQFAVRVKY